MWEMRGCWSEGVVNRTFSPPSSAVYSAPHSEEGVPFLPLSGEGGNGGERDGDRQQFLFSLSIEKQLGKEEGKRHRLHQFSPASAFEFFSVFFVREFLGRALHSFLSPSEEGPPSLLRKCVK